MKCNINKKCKRQWLVSRSIYSNEINQEIVIIIIKEIELIEAKMSRDRNKAVDFSNILSLVIKKR